MCICQGAGRGLEAHVYVYAHACVCICLYAYVYVCICICVRVRAEASKFSLDRVAIDDERRSYGRKYDELQARSTELQASKQQWDLERQVPF